MKKRREVEVLARGVCVADGHVLLCHSKGAANTYLPGGHVDFGEGARDSLAREVMEELGLKCTVGRFLGAVEHTFLQKGEPHCEVNLVFELRIPRMSSAAAPRAEEDHIEFLWAPLAGLGRARLEPAPLRRSLARWLSAPAAGWGSTFGNET
jgi:8-oxo-dGTP pyrophosphatase MutT (NUDIX family)